jgi:excisionase family DNA binding protein
MPRDTYKLAMSIAEFARLAGVGRSTLYNEIKSGRLKVRKAGRRSLILREEGLAWLATLPVASAKAFPESIAP